MSSLGFDYTSNLVDLLMSPNGSQPLFETLVPTYQRELEVGSQEKLLQLESHLVSHGLNQESLKLIKAGGFKSLDLLSFLSCQDISQLFPSMSSQQRRLLDICIARLDSRPSYQVSAGLRRYLSQPVKNLFKVKEQESKAGGAGETRGGVSAALRLVESTRKVLECPVCYLPCPPPRIYQCNNGHLTCAPCHSQTRQGPECDPQSRIISRFCPLCRTAFSSVRPLAAEKLAAELPTPCKNQSHGCEVSLPWAERLDHEAACPRALGHCPVLSCPALVPLDSILQHMTATHGWSEDFIHHKLDTAVPSFSSSISTTTYLHTLQDQQNWWWGPQCISFDHNLFFMLISRNVEQPGERGFFNFWVWLAGNSSTTERYRYTILVRGEGTGSSSEQISYISHPVCLEVGLETVREEQLSLLLSDGAVKRLMSNLERLHYVVKLEKVD